MIKKVLFAAVAFLSLNFNASAIEPTNLVSDGPVSVTLIFAGDYNAPQGRVYVGCSNGNLYHFSLGTEFANLMYSNAAMALTLGKRISVVRRPSTTTGVANEFEAFRLILIN